MITIEIPDFGSLELEHLLLDYNGTLAVDGELIDGVAARLLQLAQDLEIRVVTADTFGRVQTALDDLPCDVTILPPGAQDQAKLELLRRLGPEATVAIGNGRNDRLMLADAALGIVVLHQEGAATAALTSADLVVPNIIDALDLLVAPLRLVASLRS